MHAQAERYGVTIIEMKDMPESGADVVQLLNTLLPVDAPVYISFDLDALDPAHAPGVSHWEPGGILLHYNILIYKCYIISGLR
jgi:arginase